MNPGWKFALVAPGILVLAACSGGSARVGNAARPPAATGSDQTEAAFGLMMRGELGSARKRLRTLLKREPMNATARLLNDSLARDPQELLGPQNHRYGVRTGDTMESLAQRFLGNRYKAYQLARYNGLKTPVTLAPGQILLIPGEAPRPEPVRRTDSAPTRPAPAPPAAKPAPSVQRPAVAPANPAAARQLRASGLAALNQGQVARAVRLLARAAQLEPGNAMIARDLARAQRIAATVRARR